MLPDQPPTFSSPPAPDQPWRWRLLDEGSTPVELDGDLGSQTFPSQSDAESWLGEFFGELADAGVDQVTLLEADREVYGPMSLHA
ncbi:hypothetical protein [Nocardioides daejeonensis]|uniref:hypothetical protein n=1 Tax=Nocardioides daejeonensis TaxID=1046556 RepID=UPI001EF6CE40|nr:hypothetical protein [Nocardioides daejeonensis]